MTLWHPHTDTPAESGTVAVIAILLGDESPAPTLVDGLYHWIAGRWISEASAPHRTVLDEAVFWWCAETALLDTLIGEHDIDAAPGKSA